MILRCKEGNIFETKKTSRLGNSWAGCYYERSHINSGTFFRYNSLQRNTSSRLHSYRIISTGSTYRYIEFKSNIRTKGK